MTPTPEWSVGPAAARHTAGMTFDPELVDRVRTVLGEEPGLSERKMFGGHAFLVRGNLAVSASSTGGLMVRADPARAAALLATEGVEPFAMNGRAMRGWLAVDADVVTEDDDLRTWVEHGLRHARALPVKG